MDIIDLSEWAKRSGYRFIQHDLMKRFEAEDNEVDFITMHHTLEHFTREEALSVLKECYRVMKPGAVMRISTPDMKLLAKIYYDGIFKVAYSPVNVEVEKAPDDADAFVKMSMGGHKTGYDPLALSAILSSVGFEVKAMPFNHSQSKVIQYETIDSFPTISCYVEATKPLTVIIHNTTDKPVGASTDLLLGLTTIPNDMLDYLNGAPK